MKSLKNWQILDQILFKNYMKESVKSLSCVQLCIPMDCILQGSSVHGISQARILEWIAITFSMRSSWPRDQIWVITLLMDSLTTEPSGNLMRITFSGGNWVTQKNKFRRLWKLIKEDLTVVWETYKNRIHEIVFESLYELFWQKRRIFFSVRKEAKTYYLFYLNTGTQKTAFWVILHLFYQFNFKFYKNVIMTLIFVAS